MNKSRITFLLVSILVAIILVFCGQESNNNENIDQDKNVEEDIRNDEVTENPNLEDINENSIEPNHNQREENDNEDIDNQDKPNDDVKTSDPTDEKDSTEINETENDNDNKGETINQNDEISNETQDDKSNTTQDTNESETDESKNENLSIDENNKTDIDNNYMTEDLLKNEYHYDSDCYLVRDYDLITENNLPMYNYREDILTERISKMKDKVNNVVVNEELTSRIDSPKEDFIDDKTILDKYFPTEDIISYDYIAFDDSIPDDVKRQFFKDAYEYVINKIPKSEVDKVNNRGIAYVSEIGWDYTESEPDSARSTRYILYKNVKFKRLMLRDPIPYDPLFKAKLTRMFEILLTGRNDYFIVKNNPMLPKSFFEEHKEIILEYLYYTFDNAHIIQSESLLDPELIVSKLNNPPLPNITYESIINYFIEKEKRIDENLYYAIEWVEFPLPDNLIENFKKLYECSVGIINSDLSINASIDAILQATIASFCIQRSYKEGEGQPIIPIEVSNFMTRNPYLMDSTKEFLNGCLDLMKKAMHSYKYDLLELIDTYKRYNISFQFSSINDSIFKWDRNQDHIYYTTTALELKLFRPTLGDNFLLFDLYKYIYERNYPTLADFIYFEPLRLYTYKLLNEKGEEKWYILNVESGKKINVTEKINPKKTGKVVGLGYYRDLTGYRALFFKYNPDTLYSALIGISLTKAGSVKILNDNYYIDMIPIFPHQLTDEIIVHGHFDDKLSVNSKTEQVSYKNKTKSDYKKNLKMVKMDLNSGNIEFIEDSEGWNNIIYVPKAEYIYYNKGIEHHLYHIGMDLTYPFDDVYNFGPKKILEINNSLSKILFTKEIGRTGRDGLFIYDGTNGKSSLIEYTDRVLFTGSSTRGTYISYKSLNPFYDEENTYLVRIQFK